MRRVALSIAFVAALAAGTLRSRVDELRATLPPEADVLYLPGPQHLAWMHLGFPEALADLVWIRGLVFAGTHVGDAELAWTDRYVDGITSLAPRFRRPYLWGGIMAIYAGRPVDRAMLDYAIAIYRRGLAQFPEDSELLGSLALLLLHQAPITPGVSPEEVLVWRREGIELARRAAAFGADPLLRQYAATLMTEHGDQELAISFLENQLLQAEDEDLRRLLQRKLDELAGSGASDRVARRREVFQAARARAGATYVPDDLWAVIAPAED